MNVFAFILKYLRKTKLMAGVILFAIIARAVADRGEVFAMSQVIGILPQYTQDKAVISQIIFYIVLLAAFLLFEALANLVWRYVGGKFMPYFCSLVY